MKKCAWLAQSVEHETLNLRVVGSSPTLGALYVLFSKTLNSPLTTPFISMTLHVVTNSFLEYILKMYEEE